METASFIFYLLLFCYFVSAVPFFKKALLPTWQLISLFLIKIFAGLAYAKFYSLPKYYEGSDTWRFYNLSLKETAWLKSDPLSFFRDIFTYGYSRPGNIFSGENSYWNDLKSNVVVKLMALMNTVTFNSYYSNIIIFNFIFLFGLVALYKLLIQLYPSKKYFIIIGVFLMPSTLFWCSGIHKDGLILSATGLIIFYFSRLLNKFSARKVIALVLCLILIFALRNYVVFALLPALLAWALSERFASKKVLIFSCVYTMGLIAFFMVPLIFSSLNFPAFIADKQIEFSRLQGTSAVISKGLESSFSSFLSYLPYALDMSLLRPHLRETKNFSYIPAAIEVILILLLLVLAFIFHNRQTQKPVILFLLFFSFSILILSGYTVTFSGAIVRYRSFVLPLLITPLLCMIKLPFQKRTSPHDE